MSILLNDNLSIQAPKATDDRYGPYADLATALSSIPVTNRYQGLVVGVIVSGSIVEYWFASGISNVDLIIKVDATGSSASANTIYTQGVDATQNTAIASVNTFAGSAYGQANTGTTLAQAAYVQANTNAGNITAIQGVNDTQNTNITNTNTFAGSAYDKANTNALAITAIQGINDQQNTNITAVNTYAGSAYNTANNALPKAGGTITGSLAVNQDLSVSGNLTVLGTTTTINTTTLDVVDPVIFLASDNTSDIIDIGFAGQYKNGTDIAATGIIRDAGTKDYFIFDSYTKNLTANNQVDINDNSFRKANVVAGIFKGDLVGDTATVNGRELGAYTAAVFTQANTVTVLAQASYDQANTNASAITTIQGVNNTQNTNIASVNTFAASAYGQANTGTTLAQASFNTANTNAANIVTNQGVNDQQNTNITAVNTYTASAYGQANTGTTLAQASYDQANTNAGIISGIQGVDNRQNTNITAVNTYASSAYAKANTGTVLAQAAFNTANSNATDIVTNQGINEQQNTNISDTNTFAVSAYDQANTGTTLAQAAYGQANTNAGAITVIRGVDNRQNTNITAVNTYATSAYGQANTTASNLSLETARATAAELSITSNVDTLNATVSVIDTQLTATQNDLYNVIYPAVTAVRGVNTSQNTSIASANNLATSAYRQANIASSLAQAAFNSANTSANTNSISAQAAYDQANAGVLLSQSSFNTANNAQANTIYTQGVDTTQNTNIAYVIQLAQAAFNTANLTSNLSSQTIITLAQAAFEQANLDYVLDAVQNTHITNTNTFAAAAYDQANTGTTLAQAAFTSGNTATTLIAGINTIQNNSIRAVGTLAQAAFNTANTMTINNTELAQTIFNAVNSEIIRANTAEIAIIANVTTLQTDTTYLKSDLYDVIYPLVNANRGINTTQNNNIASANSKAFGAYDQANTGTTLAQSSFNTANNVQANTIYTQGVDATQNDNIAVINTLASNAYNQANIGTTMAQASFNVANNSLINTTYLQGVDNTQNTSIAAVNTFAVNAYTQANTATTLAQLALNTANAVSANSITLAQAAFNAINTESSRALTAESAIVGNVSILQTNTTNIGNDLYNVIYPAVTAVRGVNTSQNTSIASANNLATSAYGQANIGILLAQASFNVANTASANTIYTQGVDATQNTNISLVNQLAQAAFDKANASNLTTQTIKDLAQAAFEQANLDFILDVTQNTHITNTNTFAGSAYDQANTGINLAQAAYNAANLASNSATVDLALSTAQAAFNTINNYSVLVQSNVESIVTGASIGVVVDFSNNSYPGGLFTIYQQGPMVFNLSSNWSLNSSTAKDAYSNSIINLVNTSNVVLNLSLSNGSFSIQNTDTISIGSTVITGANLVSLGISGAGGTYTIPSIKLTADVQTTSSVPVSCNLTTTRPTKAASSVILYNTQPTAFNASFSYGNFTNTTVPYFNTSLSFTWGASITGTVQGGTVTYAPASGGPSTTLTTTGATSGTSASIQSNVAYIITSTNTAGYYGAGLNGAGVRTIPTTITRTVGATTVYWPLFRKVTSSNANPNFGTGDINSGVNYVLGQGALTTSNLTDYLWIAIPGTGSHNFGFTFLGAQATTTPSVTYLNQTIAGYPYNVYGFTNFNSPTQIYTTS